MSAPAGGPRVVTRGPEAPPGTSRSRSRLPAAGFAVLLLGLLAALLWGGYETRRAIGLQGRVEALSGELVRARAEVAAHERHLAAIRASVADLQERVGALADLARRDPGAPALAPAEPAQPAPDR